MAPGADAGACRSLHQRGGDLAAQVVGGAELVHHHRGAQPGLEGLQPLHGPGQRLLFGWVGQDVGLGQLSCSLGAVPGWVSSTIQAYTGLPAALAAIPSRRVMLRRPALGSKP